MSKRENECSPSRLCYAVRLYVEVNSSEGVEGELRGVDYTKDCELPFVPTIGLKIGDIKYNRDPHTVGEVVWCMDEQRFEVRCESELWEGTNESVDREMRERDWVTA